MRPLCKPELKQGRMHPQGLLMRIDAAKAATDPAHALSDAVPAGCNPVRVAVSPSGQQLWVTARGENALLRFQVDAWVRGGHVNMDSFAIGPSPVGVAAHPDGRQVWVAVSSRFDPRQGGRLARLLHVNGESPMTVQSLPSAGFPREITFLPGGRTVIATLFAAGQVEWVPVADTP